MVINNGIAEALEYGDIINGGLIFPDSVTAIDADIGQVEEMLELVRKPFVLRKTEERSTVFHTIFRISKHSARKALKK